MASLNVVFVSSTIIIHYVSCNKNLFTFRIYFCDLGFFLATLTISFKFLLPSCLFLCQNTRNIFQFYFVFQNFPLEKSTIKSFSKCALCITSNQNILDFLLFVKLVKYAVLYICFFYEIGMCLWHIFIGWEETILISIFFLKWQFLSKLKLICRYSVYLCT